MTLSRPVRRLLILGVSAFVVWFGIEIFRAGGDPPPPPSTPQTTMKSGHAEGRRLKLPSWSLDYDSITTSVDGTTATLEHVRDGEYFKKGKPFARMTADHVVVNLITNDFTATGPIQLTENDGLHARRFTTDAAVYSGIGEVLTLSHPTTIVSDKATVHVTKATINFKTGETTFDGLVGTY